MAAVVHDLWMNQDGGLLIMPGSMSFDVPNIRDELTRHVGDNWNPIVEREVDGKASIPYQKDKESPRFARYMAARRVARTICLALRPARAAIKSAAWNPAASGLALCSPVKIFRHSTMR